MEYQLMPILSVKFKIPEPRKNYVLRKNLIDKLRSADKKKVTIVKAGAGSGKTTLLTSFIKENKLSNVRWITMDENMNQVFIFWKYILEGTRDFLGEPDGDFQNWFESNMQKDNLWQLLTMYVNKLYQKEDVFLVLDDFQYVTEEFLISTIDFFITNMPDNLHLILLSRVIPDINLGTLSMEDNLLLIDEQEIKMSEEESREFLVRTLAMNEEEDKIKAIISNSNGWVGGLQLMAVAARQQSRTAIPDLNTSNRLIGDYITNEIYIYLTEEERDFLKKTAILGYFNKKICEEYIPEYDFNEIMGSILKKNLFVVSIDNEAQVYRYHSIMKDYLISLLEKNQEQKDKLHNLAADIYYQLGDYEESLSHLFAVKAYEKIMKLLLNMPQTSSTFSYIMKVPMEEIIKSPDFAFQYYFCYYASLEVETCKRIYCLIMNNMKNDATFVAFKHADLFFNLDWTYKGIDVISFDQIDAMPLNPVTKAYLLLKETYFLFLADRYKEALSYLDHAQKIYEKSGNLFIEAFVLAEKTQILEDYGELSQSLMMYKQMEKIIENTPTIRPSYYIGIAGVYIKQMALDKAREALKNAKEAMAIPIENVNSAYLYTLAELSYVSGEPEKTEKIIRDLAKSELYKSIFFLARLLRYPIYRGNYKNLAIKFEKDYEAADESIKNMDTELLYAGIIYENGNIERAITLTDRLIAKSRKLQNKLKIVEGVLLKVRIISEQEGSDREVVNMFIEAVSYAFDDVIALPFWFEKETVLSILEKYEEVLAGKLEAEQLVFVKKIMGADQVKGINITQTKGYDLTERELEVLNEMKKGYSNKQIAEKLCISLATVKSHIINIYGKLGVNNRVAAINRIN